jgi:hypothetical protein
VRASIKGTAYIYIYTAFGRNDNRSSSLSFRAPSIPVLSTEISSLTPIHTLPLERVARCLPINSSAVMSSTEHTTISPSNLQLIIDALGDYAYRMGINFAQNPFAEELQRTNTPNDILNILQEREKALIQYRNRNRTLINCFGPGVRVLQIFSQKLGDAVGLVSSKIRFLSFVTM